MNLPLWWKWRSKLHTSYPALILRRVFGNAAGLGLFMAVSHVIPANWVSGAAGSSQLDFPWASVEHIKPIIRPRDLSVGADLLRVATWVNARHLRSHAELAKVTVSSALDYYGV